MFVKRACVTVKSVPAIVAMAKEETYRVQIRCVLEGSVYCG